MKYDPSAIIEMVVFLVCLEAAVLWPVFALQQINNYLDQQQLENILYSLFLHFFNVFTCKDDKLTFGSKLSVSIILLDKTDEVHQICFN